MKKPSPSPSPRLPSSVPSPSSLMGLFFLKRFCASSVSMNQGRFWCYSSTFKEPLIFFRHWTKLRMRSMQGDGVMETTERRHATANEAIILPSQSFFSRKKGGLSFPLHPLPFIDLSAVPARSDIACRDVIVRKQKGRKRGKERAGRPALLQERKGAPKNRKRLRVKSNDLGGTEFFFFFFSTSTTRFLSLRSSRALALPFSRSRTFILPS